MARHRRNVIPLQPRKLLEFHEADWLPDTGLAAWERWSHARLDYLKDRWPETLAGATVLDLVYEDPP